MSVSETAASTATDFVRQFDQLGIDDVPIVGGKNASLGEMIRELKDHGINVPNGFATKTAKAAGSKIGICGQAPSNFPDFAEFLVEAGIDSISVTPDVALKTKLIIARAESKLAGKT